MSHRVQLMFLLTGSCLFLMIAASFNCSRRTAFQESNEALYRSMAIMICNSIEKYREQNVGRIPALSALLQEDSLLRETAAASGFNLEGLAQTFEIVTLPPCIHGRDGSVGGYVVVVRKVPDGVEWSTVFVCGNEVKLK